MKNYILLCLSFFLFYLAYSQEKGSMIVGAKAGLNLANIGGRETDNAMKLGAQVGGYGQYYFDPSLDMVVELVVSGQGHAPKTDLDNKLKLLYFNIPVVVRIFLLDNLNLHLGPQFGFLLSAKSKYQNVTFDVKDLFNGFDLGLSLGAGYDFELFNQDLNANLRYTHGITNISTGTISRFNRVIQLSLGINLYKIK